VPDYSKLPGSLQNGMKRYIEEGVIPGHFLRAVLENNLSESFARADDMNRLHMYDIVSWMYNEAPIDCWGSEKKVKAWIEMRRAEKSET